MFEAGLEGALKWSLLEEAFRLRIHQIVSAKVCYEDRLTIAKYNGFSMPSVGMRIGLPLLKTWVDFLESTKKGKKEAHERG